MIDHINRTWKEKKRADFNYPFRPQDMQALGKFSDNFQEWGIMALWDVYLDTANEWVKKNGYSLSGFFGALAWLVDDRGWKDKAGAYRSRLEEPLDKRFLELFDMVTKK